MVKMVKKIEKDNWIMDYVIPIVGGVLLFVFIYVIFLGGFNKNDITSLEYDLEASTEDIFSLFGGLSELQQEEKIKELKGKRIKTSIYVSKIDKATLSTQYVVMEMHDYPYSLSPYAKAFFPNEEKDNLLNVNIGDTIIFSGEFVTYKERALTSYVEFTKSKFIEIK